ncbi:troponin C-like isoform X1 [Trichogramma pretiosum]|uniref:troponin C-like isoform X1 n=2 Tax=Trichogramma pretiosum TaxID=7493 RepID=UPI0006C9D838|nr:troponin C-like isoform X1 [Trichogramma pretiosum]
MEDLSKEQVQQLQMAFDAFDHQKKGIVSTDMIGTMLGMLGHEIRSSVLSEVIAEFDPHGRKEIRFDTFCNLAARFLEDDADAEAVQAELREAFRLYDKEGNGYITTEVFRDILHELDDNLTPEELDMMIDEIDADGSGTLDFDEFMEAMTK